MKHFCSTECRDDGEQCDLCLAQERFRREQKLRAEQKPTLHHNPFASLLPKFLK